MSRLPNNEQTRYRSSTFSDRKYWAYSNLIITWKIQSPLQKKEAQRRERRNPFGEM